MKSLQSLTLDFCLKLIVGFALLLHCSSVNIIQITHYHSHVKYSAVKWWSAESIKKAQNVIFFIGLSGLLATPHSYSRSMNQQAVCSPHSLCVLLSFLCMDKDESGAEETRYGHYRRRRLTIVASLQATVSAHSEDQGSSSLFHWPQPVACSKRT